SLLNCMLRIPGSFNSKYIQFSSDGRGNIISISPEAEVRIVKRWDGNIPRIGGALLTQYYTYRQFAAIRDIRKRNREEHVARKYGKPMRNRPGDLNSIQWIEKLLGNPIDAEGRYYCVWRVLAPYLITAKRLSRSDAFDIISSWLDRCGSLRRLSF